MFRLSRSVIVMWVLDSQKEKKNVKQVRPLLTVLKIITIFFQKKWKASFPLYSFVYPAPT